MSRRRALPDAGPDAARAIAELTRIVNEFDARIERLERAAFVETDLARPPVRVGAVAVAGGEAYIAVGRSPADWKLVT